jgi:SAM-dependent methyltransferase
MSSSSSAASSQRLPPLWDLLVCPSCGDELTLELYSGTPAAPEDGLLHSGCGLWFPVVRGIPRIFVGEMRASIYPVDFADFLQAHGLSVDGAAAAGTDTKLKLATRESFGYEWTHYHEMLPSWEENANFYFEPVGGPRGLRDLLCLEGGCGKGRHSYYAILNGARLVAVDFSRAVDVAKNNCAQLAGDRLFVQADLMSLPFREQVFDLAYSLGVLHHLPDPEAGYRKLVARVRNGGRVLIYLYHALEGEPVKQMLLGAVTLARRVTTRLPHRVLLPLTTALGYGLYAGVVLPYRALARFPRTRPFAESLPLKSYAAYPVRVIINDQFDRFSAPIEHRYKRDEVAAWLSGAGLTAPSILGGAGWRAVGVKRG